MWRMEQGGLWPPVLGRAQEPPLSSRWSLLIGTGYNCRRPLRSCTELPVLGKLEHGSAPIRERDLSAPLARELTNDEAHWLVASLSAASERQQWWRKQYMAGLGNNLVQVFAT